MRPHLIPQCNSCGGFSFFLRFSLKELMYKIANTIKLILLIISQFIQTLVMIWFDNYEVKNTYSEMRKIKKIKKNKKKEAIDYLNRLYRKK